jgi:hypothetical protein
MTERMRYHQSIRIAVVLLAMTAIAAMAACGDDDDDEARVGSASVSFVAPGDGDSIAGGVDVELAADGVTIEPAGEVRDGAGHFHVVADAGCVAAGEVIPRDADHLHLGQGQADGVLYLGPGSHELCVQVGDGAHTASDITETITIDVGIEDRGQWCAVVEEVDGRFEEVDNAGEDFAVAQVSYAGIGRLLDQVIAAIDQVDAEVRDEVLAGIEVAHEITDAYADAADVGEAEENLEPIFTSGEPIASEAAVAWILDTCGVDIDG